MRKAVSIAAVLLLSSLAHASTGAQEVKTFMSNLDREYFSIVGKGDGCSIKMQSHIDQNTEPMGPVKLVAAFETNEGDSLSIAQVDLKKIDTTKDFVQLSRYRNGQHTSMTIHLAQNGHPVKVDIFNVGLGGVKNESCTITNVTLEK